MAIITNVDPKIPIFDNAFMIDQYNEHIEKTFTVKFSHLNLTLYHQNHENQSFSIHVL